MGQDILWLDTETTGLDPENHAIIQLACLVERNNKIIDKLMLYIRPFKGAKISKEALGKNKVTIEDLRDETKYIDHKIQFEVFIDFMNNHVDRFDKKNKFVLAGKNIKTFDIKFLRKWFERNDDNYYGSWFWYPCIDIENYLAELLVYENIILKNYKIETLCEYFDIELKAHISAYDDIVATREIYKKIFGK